MADKGCPVPRLSQKHLQRRHLQPWRSSGWLSPLWDTTYLRFYPSGSLVATQGLPAGGTFPLSGSTHNRSLLSAEQVAGWERECHKAEVRRLARCSEPSLWVLLYPVCLPMLCGLSTSVGLSESLCFGCKMESAQCWGWWLFLVCY